jgi:hypothetical protein
LKGISARELDLDNERLPCVLTAHEALEAVAVAGFHRIANDEAEISIYTTALVSTVGASFGAPRWRNWQTR